MHLNLSASNGESLGVGVNGNELSKEIVESLVVSVLSVNSYPIAKAWGLLPRLRESRLTEPQFVVGLDLGRLTVLLATAGYGRGMLIGLFAERIKDLMTAISSGALDQLPAAIVSREKGRAAEILCAVRGVGKKVAENALMLLISDDA
jgi:hypothetical protein